MRLFKKSRPGLTPASSEPRSESKGEFAHVSDSHYDIGVVSDCNVRYRKTMEDAHVVITDYMGVPGCAYFAVFDGHAGSKCSKALEQNLHLLLADELDKQGNEKDIAAALAASFSTMDAQLPTMDIAYSGSTAVVAVSCYMNDQNEFAEPGPNSVRKLFVANAGDSRAVLGVPTNKPDCVEVVDNASTDTIADVDADGSAANTIVPPTTNVRYTARRLSYDHRCSDPHEQRRVANAGGLMINNRVNGMLAVTRALGDLSMKEYVTSAPYTTETTLPPTGNEVLILACDGLWDVCSDERAVELARSPRNALQASEKLLKHALEEFSVDNLTVMVISWL